MHLYFLYSVLEEQLKKHKMSDMVAFVDPAMIGATGCGTVGDRSRALSIRFRNANPGQIFLLPYHSALVLLLYMCLILVLCCAYCHFSCM